MVTLSAFADEISEDLNEQVTVLRATAIDFVDIREVGGRNVMQLSPSEAREARDTLDRHGIEVASLASPVGKCPAETPLEQLRDQLEHASALAHILGTPTVRIFSFYPPGWAGHAAGDAATVDRVAWREAVVARLSAMTTWARECGVRLLVENDRGTYAETVAGSTELLTLLGSEHMGMVLDPANFLVCGQTPHPDQYQALRRWVHHVHVKDVSADGGMVVAGEGEVGWRDLLSGLRDDGYRGFLSLEPHLSRAGQFGGFTGPAPFLRAAAALRDLLAGLDWSERPPAVELPTAAPDREVA